MLFVGIGGGIELLQCSYFSRRAGAVIGLDVVDEMISACTENLQMAERENAWFKRDFVDLRRGDALNLPIADNSIGVAAQNCLFNIFHETDLTQALAEMYRVLKPHGRLICPTRRASKRCRLRSRRTSVRARSASLARSR